MTCVLLLTPFCFNSICFQLADSFDKPVFPKKLKFQDGDGTTGLNKVDENGKGSILFSLAPADQPLVDRINTFNNQRLDNFKMYGPEYKVVSGKTVGTVFSPDTGNVQVRFKTVPWSDEKNKDKVFTLTVDSFQFSELVHKARHLLELVYSVEDKSHPDYLVRRSPKEILGWETYPGRTYSTYNDWEMCKLEFIDDLHIDVRWNLKNKETLIKIYRGECEPFFWRASDNAINFRAGGFELFVRNLIPKLRNCVRYWGNVYRAGKDTWASLYSTYEPRHEFFQWGKRFGWWMPVEDEDMYGDYEEKEHEDREKLGESENTNSAWKIIEEDGRSYYSC